MFDLLVIGGIAGMVAAVTAIVWLLSKWLAPAPEHQTAYESPPARYRLLLLLLLVLCFPEARGFIWETLGLLWLCIVPVVIFVAIAFFVLLFCWTIHEDGIREGEKRARRMAPAEDESDIPNVR